MLSKEVRSAIEAEVEHLRIRRKKLTERLDAKIAALELALTPDEDDGPVQLPLNAVKNTASLNVTLAPVKVQGKGKVGNAPKPPMLGFRSAIRDYLAEHPQSKPGEVARALAEGGFRPAGTTPLSTRVANEMSRMAGADLLVKNGPRYSLPDGSAAA